MQRPLGCKRDPVSSRDLLFADHRAGFDARIGAVASEDMRLLQFAEIRQQVGQSCVGEWVAQSQGIRDRFLGENVRYSSLAAYHFARVQELSDSIGESPPHDWYYADDGTYLRAAAKAVCKFGFVPEGALEDGAWPLDRRCLLKCPSRQALDNARSMRGKRYLRIAGYSDERADDIARSVRAGFPVGISIEVDQEIINWTGSNPIVRPRGKVIGRHALTICAIRSDGCFGGPSTWGLDWADGGIFWLSPIALNPADVWVLAGGEE